MASLNRKNCELRVQSSHGSHPRKPRPQSNDGQIRWRFYAKVEYDQLATRRMYDRGQLEAYQLPAI